MPSITSNDLDDYNLYKITITFRGIRFSKMVLAKEEDMQDDNEKFDVDYEDFGFVDVIEDSPVPPYEPPPEKEPTPEEEGSQS
jgi:hypothetical protein